jgi:hypothetical protein
MRLIASVFIFGVVVGYVTSGLRDATIDVPISPRTSVPATNAPSLVHTVESEVVTDETPGTTESVVDENLHVRFLYRSAPNGYHVARVVQTDNDDPTFVGGYQLTRITDAEALQNVGASEAPPRILVRVYENRDRLAPLVWADTLPLLSNKSLASAAATSYSSHGGDGLRYTVDGLYLIDTVVLGKQSKIYVVSGEYDDPTSPIRRDFGTFLDSFEITL